MGYKSLIHGGSIILLCEEAARESAVYPLVDNELGVST
jgi:hypothetical protein